MRTFKCMAFLAIVVITISSQDAQAFSVDSKADTNSDGSARFTDPEDQAMDKLGLTASPSSASSGTNGTALDNSNLPLGMQNTPVIQKKYR